MTPIIVTPAGTACPVAPAPDTPETERRIAEEWQAMMNGYSMEFGMGSNGMSVKMSDFPERISISPVHRQKRDDDFYLVDRNAFPGKGTEYTRSDLAQAMVANAQEETKAKTLATISLMLGDSAILALATTEEEALLEKMLAKVREEALRDAAEMVNRNLGKPAHHAHAAILALIGRETPPKPKKPNLVGTGTVSVREAARVLLDATRIEPVHDAIQRSVRPAAFCAALRTIAEGKGEPSSDP
jgi:hypothetical protein